MKMNSRQFSKKIRSRNGGPRSHGGLFGYRLLEVDVVLKVAMEGLEVLDLVAVIGTVGIGDVVAEMLVVGL